VEHAAGESPIALPVLYDETRLAVQRSKNKKGRDGLRFTPVPSRRASSPRPRSVTRVRSIRVSYSENGNVNSFSYLSPEAEELAPHRPN
jgi:hypothetical protein